ncbi:MAG: 5-formyltetrahydrofolate cyclo-ligase [Hyphomicrobiaceae bacterium]|nr:5-formyltetrahydrofolate cyclo-ligase [Hyphomicrobiaceae bacterium]
MMPPEIAAWRQGQRKRLLELRRSLPLPERAALIEPLLGNLRTVLERLELGTLGIYWPIQREVDVRPLADEICDRRGAALALPVVVRKGAPLEYWQWRMGDSIERGFWNIPVPRQRHPVEPDAVVAPLVGFWDHYRLGYGGGYFDRTLAAARKRPYAIGLGFELSRLDGFVPQPHDIPMDVIVTDASIHERPRGGGADAGHC